MATHVDVDVPQLWRDYRANPTIEQRNQLLENYLPLVKYNAERIWCAYRTALISMISSVQEYSVFSTRFRRSIWSAA